MSDRRSDTPSTRVTFTADGLTLAGTLTVAAAGAPAVVLTGPFTGVKEQVVGTYAARLHERGLTTLAFDHRGFGESGGRRAHEDSQGKIADLRAAVSLLAAHPAVGAARVAAVGICLGGGYAVRAPRGRFGVFRCYVTALVATRAGFLVWAQLACTRCVR